jgi:hypothetical protein
MSANDPKRTFSEGRAERSRRATMPRIPDQNSLTLIVSWFDRVKRFTLNLRVVVFYQSNLSH